MIKKLLLILFVANSLFAQKESIKIDSILSSIYGNDKPGVSVIIKKNGATVYKRSIGLAVLGNNCPINSETNFNICSLTKQITAYAVTKLSFEKKISLDDPIIKFFPEMNPKVANKIKIRNLLNHSSGLIDHYNLVDRKAFKHFLDKDAFEAIKSIDSTYFPVGKSYRYSNTAFCLLALVIEKVTGESYPEYIKEKVFKPLKMNNSLVLEIGKDIKNRALGYDFEAQTLSYKLNDVDESPFFSTMGDGGVYTSIEDYIKWVEALRENKILKKQVIAEVHKKQNAIIKDKDLYYGFGWFVSGKYKNLCYYHTGSNGGFRTIVYTNPAAKYSLVIFSNQNAVDLEVLAKKLNQIYKIDNSSFIALDSLIS